MTNIPAIRRRSDGSIDTAFYLAQGRDRRSEAACEIAGRVLKKIRSRLDRFGRAPRLPAVLGRVGLKRRDAGM